MGGECLFIELWSVDVAEDSDLEKTEQPSERRLQQARDDGQVARSRELSTFMGLRAGGGWFVVDGRPFVSVHVAIDASRTAV